MYIVFTADVISKENFDFFHYVYVTVPGLCVLCDYYKVPVFNKNNYLNGVKLTLLAHTNV